MSTLVKLEHCSYTLAGSCILDRVSLEIKKGDCIRLAGSNGSGKTTLLRIIKGEINPDGGIGPSREYFFNNESSSSPIHAKRHVRMVSPVQQNLYRLKGWNITGLECVITGRDDTALLYHDIAKEEITMAETVLDRLGFLQLKDKTMMNMSRGEARKILIARALFSQPELVLLDEFLHELDPGSRAEMIRAVERMHADGAAIIYTTHIEGETLSCTTSAHRLQRGAEHKADESKVKRVRKADAVIECASDRLFFLENLYLYLHDRPVLRDINFEVRRGEHWVIVGGNGSGKSTLLKTMYGYLRPSIDSYIERLGVPDGSALADVFRSIGLVSSELQCSVYSDTPCLDIVASAYTASIASEESITEDHRSRAAVIMEHFGMTEFSSRAYSGLSYGEQRKIIFLRACAHDPCVLLLDEPFAGIDADSRIWMMKEIEEMSINGTVLVTAVHHIEDIPSTSTHLLHLDNGTVRYKGKRENFPERSWMAAH